MAHKRFKVGTVALERALSKLGLASRSQARKLIERGRVKVGGKVVTDSLHAVRPESARIELDGQAKTAARKVVYMLHKPRGTVTTTRDPEGRATVLELLTGIEGQLHAVGRLDFATSGLLLLTNETQLSAFLSDPASGIVRTYLVTVRGEVKPETIRAWTKGVDVKGERLIAKEVRIQKASGRETHLVMMLTEGKNREVRRLCKAAGHEVTRLRRAAFGGLELGGLEPGAFRKISVDELSRAMPTIPKKILERIS
ncbi:MAG TPA: pseudouridine synthase [Bdellovibrionota bacterium]|nr:pseudouridine synthase [Bdellovibrionota bacterium]